MMDHGVNHALKSTSSLTQNVDNVKKQKMDLALDHVSI